jgi:hypothetical protein
VHQFLEFQLVQEYLYQVSQELVLLEALLAPQELVY